MSTSYNTYVGPYIKIYNPELYTTIVIKGCAWNKCEKYKILSHSNYCSMCGNPIIEVEVPSITKKIKLNVYTELNEKLYNPYTEYSPKHLKDYDIYIPNIKGYGYHPTDETYEFEMIDGDIHNVLCNFNMSMEDEIIILKKKFGIPNVKTQYGVLGYLT